MNARVGLAAAACALAVGTGCGGEDEAETETDAPARPALEQIGEFREPVHLAEPPVGDGTLFVVERAGAVRTLEPDGGVGAFLDLSAAVSTEGEGGLFSLAFAPDYSRTGRLYVAYSSRDKQLVVAEYRAEPGSDEVDLGSRREILAITHPNPIHWGGLLAFGPDGKLYLGTGEGGPVDPIPDRAQDPRSLLGKLLRLDPRRRTAEVVAVGLRNPWRYSFDRETGDLWIGDVGDFTEEEVDHVPAEEIEGADFGWPAREGTAPTKSEVRPQPGAVIPVLTYSRTGHPDEGRCAITGGYVVRDPGLPTLAGKYLYGDFCEGEILSFDPEAKGRSAERGSTGLTVPRLASFAEDQAGRLYVLSLEGPVYRIAPG